MSSPPSRGLYRAQSRLLQEIKHFDRGELRPCPTRVVTLLGETIESLAKLRAREGAQQAEDEQRAREEAALRKLVAARQFAGKDKRPCKVADGLYIGPVGAARNLKALQKAGITHILNASPAVPCFFAEHGAFAYMTVDLFDDPAADLLAHVEAANAFIAEGRTAGGVLVHCYAGQSRSAALLMAYLMAAENSDMVTAFSLVRRARPVIKPNAGFLRQLAKYAAQLGLEGAFEIA